ncbi:hypothetical protein M569_05863 [Genlisea aurea]|uniref:Uncharacterized protein n=1 Tax=Genlisea aurea TaxID=192259 RepID=S8E8Z0_9LAMI|nr:hypothetical protein M569_05863 [Genlisea aurea]
MSKMMLRSSGKPPLARSPIRLRERKPLQPAPINILHSPPSGGGGGGGSLMKSTRFRDPENSSDMKPEYETISCELRALAKMVHQEFFRTTEDINNPYQSSSRLSGAPPKSPLFQRGRFYDEYAARRNERLKRKKGGEIAGQKPPPQGGGGYDLGVRVESAKKRETSSISRRKSSITSSSTPVAERREAAAATPAPRYSLRSSARKENNNSSNPQLPPLAAAMSIQKSDRKVGIRSSRQR